MGNVNSATVSGNLTRDPEHKQVGELEITNLGIAVNRSVKRDGEYTEEVSYLDVTVFGGFAGLVARKLKKGDSATVMGELRQERWTVGEGDEQQNRSKVVLVARQIDSEGFFRSKEEENSTDAATTTDAAPAEGTPEKSESKDDIPF